MDVKMTIMNVLFMIANETFYKENINLCGNNYIIKIFILF
jgi:hypothetical protein